MDLCESKLPNTGKGITTIVHFGPDNVVTRYYGALKYSNLSVGASHHPVVYGEGAQMVPISVLLKQCMLVYLNKPSVSPVWIFSVPFCPGTFINDPCYTKSGSRRPTVEHLPENPNAYRRTNVCFEDKRIRSSQKQVVLKALDNFAYLTRKNIVQITATCNFKAADAFSQSTVRTTLLLLDIVRYVIIVYLN